VLGTAVAKVAFKVILLTRNQIGTLFVKGSFDSWAAGHEMTKNGSTNSIVIGGNAGDKYPANTEYKYYTNDMNADNWESNSDGSNRDNRWAIAPVMGDEIARFVTAIPGTGVDEILDAALKYLQENGINGTYWSAGPRWGDYPLSVQPTNNYTQDRPQLSTLLKYKSTQQ
jgi:hypothetical protein